MKISVQEKNHKWHHSNSEHQNESISEWIAI